MRVTWLRATCALVPRATLRKRSSSEEWEDGVSSDTGRKAVQKDEDDERERDQPLHPGVFFICAIRLE